MSKIKVNFHMGRLLWGGVETVLMTYLQHFDRERFEISLTIGWCMDSLDRYSSQIPVDVKINYLVNPQFITRLKAKKIVNGRLNLVEKCYEAVVLSPIGRYIYIRNFKNQAHNYDVIIDFGLALPLGAFNIATPIITFLHFNLNSFLDAKAHNKKRIIEKFTKYSAIVVLNDVTLQECHISFPNIKDKFTRIYNVFDIDNIKIKAQELLENMPSAYIVSVGRIVDGKGLDGAIKAFTQLKNKYGYSGKYLIVGDGNLKDKLINLTKELKIDDDVVFCGNQANPYKYVKNADLLLFASKSEALPSVLIESMIVNTPIVSTDCQVGPREILEHGKCGILVAIDDVDAMTDAMNKIITDEILRNQLVKNASESLDRFSINTGMTSLYRLIDKVIEE